MHWGACSKIITVSFTTNVWNYSIFVALKYKVSYRKQIDR